MPYFVNVIDKQGNFELIDEEFVELYPDLNFEKLHKLSDEQYQAYLQLNLTDVVFINGTFSGKPYKPSENHTWNGSQWVILPEQQAVKKAEDIAKIREQINAKRDECVNGGVYVPAIEKWVDTNETGRATLVEIKADFDLNGKENSYTLICADNTARTINYEEFKAVWDSVKNLKEAMFENAYMHKILLEQADNPLEYDWSIGWAKTYQQKLAGAGDE